MVALDLEQKDAIATLVESDSPTAWAIKAICAEREHYYTEQSRDRLNLDPDSLDQQARNEHLARRYAAMAHAWRCVWSEIEKVAAE